MVNSNAPDLGAPSNAKTPFTQFPLIVVGLEEHEDKKRRAIDTDGKAIHFIFFIITLFFLITC